MSSCSYSNRMRYVNLVVYTHGNIIMLTCKANDTESSFTHRMERTAEDSNYVED